jgi:hypothetical protein
MLMDQLAKNKRVVAARRFAALHAVHPEFNLSGNPDSHYPRHYYCYFAASLQNGAQLTN